MISLFPVQQKLGALLLQCDSKGYQAQRNKDERNPRISKRPQLRKTLVSANTT